MTASTLRPLRILLVDDDQGDAFMMREILSEFEVKVQLDVVEDGMQALAYLKQQAPYERASRPDLMLLDLNMPRLDGRQVLSRIRADESLSHLPIVVLTTSEAPFDIDNCYERGSNAYLIKPLGLDLLIEQLRELTEFWSHVAVLPANPDN